VVEGISDFGGLADVGCIADALGNVSVYILGVASDMADYKVEKDGRQMIESKK
jgi:hypothetical protein